MKYVLIVVGVLLLVALVVFVLGASAPKDHQTTLSREYAAPAATVYGLVRDYDHYPAWRTGIKSMLRDGDKRYIEESGHGKIPYLLTDERLDALLVAKIDDPALPFSGTWTFEIIDKGGASELKITERGSVPNPLMRFFSTYVFSREKTIRVYLDDVGRKLTAK